MQVYLAAYKGRKEIQRPYDLVARFSDWATRKLTKGIYSHCELAVELSNGKFCCYSSSFRDKGVRVKKMPLPSDKWDLIPVHGITPVELDKFYQANQGKYDTFGALGVKFKLKESPDKWFCSEWCAAALGLSHPYQYSPVSLVEKLTKPTADLSA